MNRPDLPPAVWGRGPSLRNRCSYHSQHGSGRAETGGRPGCIDLSAQRSASRRELAEQVHSEQRSVARLRSSREGRRDPARPSQGGTTQAGCECSSDHDALGDAGTDRVVAGAGQFGSTDLGLVANPIDHQHIPKGCGAGICLRAECRVPIWLTRWSSGHIHATQADGPCASGRDRWSIHLRAIGTPTEGHAPGDLGQCHGDSKQADDGRSSVGHTTIAPGTPCEDGEAPNGGHLGARPGICSYPDH